ncbi:MAG: Holliday junction branch migration protein RuvA [Alphaproteobacteria bacterium]|nr:Holliday junction branch migration protein RuvA [Alphaproteobacteria bacterium]
MIGKLTGTIDETGSDFAIIDVNGVGYVVQCAARTLSQLPPRGGRMTLFVETQMREDAIRLFGFTTAEEREWFRLLQTVQGVGARVALSILSALSISDLTRAVAFEDKAQVGRSQGVGPKLAARIVAELKDKAAGIAAPIPVAAIGAKPAGAAGEAVSALMNLGYGRAEAQQAVAAIVARDGKDVPLQALIREGLRTLSNAA